MTCLHCLEGDCAFHASDLADDDVPGPGSEGRLQQVEHLHSGVLVLRVSGNQSLPDGVGDLYLGGVLCSVYLHVVIDERENGIESSRLAGCGLS